MKKTDGITTLTLECNIPCHISVADVFKTHLAQMKDQGVDDSYYIQDVPLYIGGFAGGKKIRIIIEEL